MSGKRLKTRDQINAEHRRAAAAQAARAAQGRRASDPRPQQARSQQTRQQQARPQQARSQQTRQQQARSQQARSQQTRQQQVRPQRTGAQSSHSHYHASASGGRRSALQADRVRSGTSRSVDRPNPNAARRKRTRRRKKSRALRVLLVILLILVIIFFCLVAFGKFELDKINRLGATVFTQENFDRDAQGADTIEAVDWGEANVATSVDGVVNVLLVGQDTRDEGVRQRSDSMIILSVNQNTEQLTMVSLMRDLYVQIPGYSDNRINAAYAFGGFELLDATIEQNFGIVIDYNIEVNFNGFKDIVDKVGGVDVELTEDEVEYMNSDRFAKTMGYNNGTPFIAGKNHLNGKQALSYARIRRVGDDYARTQRQRTVIQAVYSKARKESWTNLLGVYESVADDLTTDMDPLQLVSIAFSGYNMGLDSINSYRIPADGTFRDETINGMMVLVPNDWNETRTLIKDYLYSDPKENTDGTTTANE